MSEEEVWKLQEAIVITAELCGRQLSDLAVKIFAQDLSHHSLEPVLRALTRLRKNGRFPTIAEIESLVAPKMEALDDARDVTGLIIRAVSKYGWANPEPAEKFIGDVGWEVVKRFGGWVNLCRTLNADNQSFLTTQITQHTESALKRHQLGLEDTRPSFYKPEIEETKAQFKIESDIKF